MNAERARAILAKLEKSYRVKLGLARHYEQGGSNHPLRQRKKIEKYTEIVDALDFAGSYLEEDE